MFSESLDCRLPYQSWVAQELFTRAMLLCTLFVLQLTQEPNTSNAIISNRINSQSGPNIQAQLNLTMFSLLEATDRVFLPLRNDTSCLRRRKRSVPPFDTVISPRQVTAVHSSSTIEKRSSISTQHVANSLETDPGKHREMDYLRRAPN